MKVSQILVKKIPADKLLGNIKILKMIYSMIPFGVFYSIPSIYDIFFSVPEFPTRVNIEVTNICTARCIICPSSMMKRPRGIMSFELFKKIIDEISKYNVSMISFHIAGEPLLNPNLENMIRYAKEKKIPVTSLTTNASLLDKNRGESIIKSGIDNIFISIDGGKKEIFEKIRRGLKFEQVTMNTLDLLDTMSRLNKECPDCKLPTVTIRLIEIPGTEKAGIEYIKNLKSKIEKLNLKNVNIEVKPFISMGGQIDTKNLYNPKKQSKMGLTLKKKLQGRLSCWQLYNWLNIHWDGNVTGCCYDMDKHLILGNVHESSLYEIWHGNKFNKLREAFRQQKFEELPEFCKNCVCNRTE